MGPTIHADDIAYHLESLDCPARDRRLSAYYAEFHPLATGNVRRHHHAAVELIHLLRGGLEVLVGKEEHTLEEGDATYFDASVAHGYRKLGKKPCAAIVVLVPQDDAGAAARRVETDVGSLAERRSAMRQSLLCSASNRDAVCEPSPSRPTLGGHEQAMTGLGACLLALILFASTGGVKAEERTILLIDDFSRKDGRSALGTEWRAFTDRVMGGVSSGSASRDTLATLPCLRLQGEVSLENRGGFIQMALPLAGAHGPLDAGGYQGFRITVTGNGRTYSIHLRTTDTRRPWQYYQAPIPTTEGWHELEVPFTAFRGESIRAPLDPTRLERVAIAAAKWAGAADVAIARIALYR